MTVPADALVERASKIGGPGVRVSLAQARIGQQVDLWTLSAPTTLKAQRGDPRTLAAARVTLITP